MRKFIFSLYFLFSVSSIFSQTIIKNGQKVFGNWTKRKSPYIIKGEAVVPNGKTLNIKAGTVIEFATGDNTDFRDSRGNYNYKFDVGFLRVNGTLKASGKRNKMILFTHENKYGKWGNIVFDKSQNIYMNYCKIEFSHYIRNVVVDDNSTGALSFINCSGTIKNSIITQSWSGINAKQKSSPKIVNCIIIKNKYGIEVNSKSKVKVINSIIWQNKTQFYINAQAAIIISYSFVQSKDLINGFYSKGNLISGDSPKITDNLKLKTGSPCSKAGENGVNIGVLW